MEEDDRCEKVVLARAQPFERLGAAPAFGGQVADAYAAHADDGDFGGVDEGVAGNARDEQADNPRQIKAGDRSAFTQDGQWKEGVVAQYADHFTSQAA